MGPNLLPEILSVLLRFRLYKCAILGDVSQAILQITLGPTDRVLIRFLWYRFVPNSPGSYDTTDEVITYRFTRPHFGLTCNPFILSATIRTLATVHHEMYPTASALMGRITYIDDLETSATHDKDIVTIFFEVTSLMNTIHLPMYKWATTRPTCKTFGGHKVNRYGRRSKSSEWIGTPSLTRFTLTTRTLQAIA